MGEAVMFPAEEPVLKCMLVGNVGPRLRFELCEPMSGVWGRVE